MSDSALILKKSPQPLGVIMKTILLSAIVINLFQASSFAEPVPALQVACSTANRAGSKNITVKGTGSSDAMVAVELSVFPDPKNLSEKAFQAKLQESDSDAEKHVYLVTASDGTLGKLTVTKSVVGFEEPLCPRCGSSEIYGSSVKFNMDGGFTYSFETQDCTGVLF